MATKLERLLEKEAQLKAQIQQAKAAERTLEKKRDTRRKILVGAAVMARVDHGEWPKDDLLQMMDGFLTRQNERDLFGLDDGDATGDGIGGGDHLAKSHSGKKRAASKQTAKAKQVVEPLPTPDEDFDDSFDL